MKTYTSRAWAAFGAITKTTEEPDGSLTVEGTCSAPSRDNDGEIVTTEAMREALTPFLATFPALRVMHQPVAAGKVTAGHIQDDGSTWIRALVVDAEAVKKVRAGVLRAFSIGGRVQRRSPSDPSVIQALRLSEISLVDSPAHPDAVIDRVKAAAMEAVARAAAAEDIASMGPPPRSHPTDNLPAGQGTGDPASGAGSGTHRPATGTPSSGSVHAEGRDPHTCPRCGATLKCQRCHRTAADSPERVARAADRLGKIAGDLDRATLENSLLKRDLRWGARRLAKVQGEADTLRKSLDAANVRARTADRMAKAATEERDAANLELRRRMKGATMDISHLVAVEKGADVSGQAAAPPQPEPDVRDLIRRSHAHPLRPAADFGPLK